MFSWILEGRERESDIDYETRAHRMQERLMETAAMHAHSKRAIKRVPRDCLIFFRREVLRSVNWAGDPNKSYQEGPLGARLTPRKSFEL